ncbi:ATP binding [Branchiostoma belcheri]|nr:ATP binding [Branchiostoma belcheri]
MALSSEAIREAWTTPCSCGRDCCGKLGTERIAKARQSFWQPYSRHKQSLFIKEALRSADRRKEVDLDHHYQFSISGFLVCHKAWCTIYGIKKSRFYEVKQMYEAGQDIAPDGRKGMEYKTKKYLVAKEWLAKYAKKFGDDMPNSKNKNLPQCATKKIIFEAYEDDHWNEETLKESRFLQMWKREFPNLKIPKKNRFTKCTECDTLKKLLKSATTKEDIKEIQDRRTAHFSLQNSARQKYYKHIKKARNQPENYLSIIIDSMDQNKTSVPHFATQTKLQASLKPLRVHLTGALAHGQERAFIYAWTEKFRMDTNITVNVLICVLLELAKDYNGHLPNTLYLQLDNSAKECKNKYIIAFAAWLVHLHIFRKVKLGYLMPGHTHEDVDQMFSRFSTHLERKDAPTIPELLQQLSNAYKPQPECRVMSSMWDFRDTIDKEIATISGHSRPHHFTAKLVSGNVQLRAKLWPDPQEEEVDIPAMLRPDHPLHDLAPVQRHSATGRSLRNSHDITIPHARTKRLQQSFLHCAIRLYNDSLQKSA